MEQTGVEAFSLNVSAVFWLVVALPFGLGCTMFWLASIAPPTSLILFAIGTPAFSMVLVRTVQALMAERRFRQSRGWPSFMQPKRLLLGLALTVACVAMIPVLSYLYAHS